MANTYIKSWELNGSVITITVTPNTNTLPKLSGTGTEAAHRVEYAIDTLTVAAGVVVAGGPLSAYTSATWDNLFVSKVVVTGTGTAVGTHYSEDDGNFTKEVFDDEMLFNNGLEVETGDTITVHHLPSGSGTQVEVRESQLAEVLALLETSLEAQVNSVDSPARDSTLRGLGYGRH